MSFYCATDHRLRKGGASRVVLPVANSMISTTQVIFSGDPLMTLKVRLQFGSVFCNTARHFSLKKHTGRDNVTLNNLGVCDCCNVRYYLFFFAVLNMGVWLQCGGF
jgi:hypothetical protein